MDSPYFLVRAYGVNESFKGLFCCFDCHDACLNFYGFAGYLKRLLAMRWTYAESYLVFLICRAKESESLGFLGYRNGTARVPEGG